MNRAFSAFAFILAAAPAYAQVKPSQPVAPLSSLGLNSLTRAAIPSSRPSSAVSSIVTSGFSAAGDRGAGCIFVRGSASGPGAVQDAAGAYWQIPAGQPVRVECFGAIGGGDVTAAFQSAINAASALNGGVGGTVVADSPAGYSVTSISTPNGQVIRGGGGTPLNCIGPATTCVRLYGNSASIQGFHIRRGGEASNPATDFTGTAVQVGNNSLEQAVKVADNFIDKFETGIDVESSVSYKLINNIIRATSRYGIRLRNVNEPDAGDGLIQGGAVSNTDPNGPVGEAAIRYETGGGLKITSIKILGFQRGIDLQIPNGKGTVDLLISNTSIENQTINNIRTGRVPGGNGSFSTTTITGNQFANAPVGISLEAGAYNTTISGNAFNLYPGESAAIQIADDVEPVSIPPGSNTFVSTAIPIRDLRSVLNASPITQIYGRSFSTASTSTWTNVGRVSVPNFRAATMEIVAEGLLQNVGGFARVKRFVLGREGGNISAIDDGTTSQYGPNFDFNIDTASIPGSAVLQIRRNASDGAGAAFLQGGFSVRLGGKVLAYYPN